MSAKRRPEVRSTGSLLGGMYAREPEPAAPPVVGPVDSELSVLTVSPWRVAPNPLNPRRHLRGHVKLEDLDLGDLQSMEDVQLQRASVATFDTFMSLVPEAVTLGLAPSVDAVRRQILETTPECDWVAVGGSRRDLAARKYNLQLDIEVRNNLAGTIADLYQASGRENADRKDLSPIDWAHLVKDMVTIHGTPGAAAKELRKSPSWVTQYIALLTLPDWVQERIDADALSLTKARRITPLGPEVLDALSGRKIDLEDALGLANEDDPDERSILLRAVVQAGPGQLAELRRVSAHEPAAPGYPLPAATASANPAESLDPASSGSSSAGFSGSPAGPPPGEPARPAGRGRPRGPRTTGRYELTAEPSAIAGSIVKDLGSERARSVAQAILAE